MLRGGVTLLASTHSAERRERLLLIAAMGLAVALSAIFVGLMQKPQSSTAAQPLSSFTSDAVRFNNVRLYVPEGNIKAGTALEGQHIREKEFRRADLPEGAILDIGELTGKYATSDLFPGLPIVRAAIGATPPMDSVQIEKGALAVTIELNAEDGNVGLARPGAFVDVILTATRAQSPYSAILFSNVKVLSRMGERDNANTPARPTILSGRIPYTIQVTPQQAVELQLARKLGELSIALRSAGSPVTPPIVVRPEQIIKPEMAPVAKRTDCGRMKVDGQDFIIDCETRQPVPAEGY